MQVKIREVVQGPNGEVEVIREYDHPSTGTFWNDAQNEASFTFPLSSGLESEN